MSAISYTPSESDIKKVKQEIRRSYKDKLHMDKALLKKFKLNKKMHEMAKKGIYYVLAYMSSEKNIDFKTIPKVADRNGNQVDGKNSYFQLLLEYIEHYSNPLKDAQDIVECLNKAFENSVSEKNKSLGAIQAPNFVYLKEFIKPKDIDNSKNSVETRKRSGSFGGFSIHHREKRSAESGEHAGVRPRSMSDGNVARPIMHENQVHSSTSAPDDGGMKPQTTIPNVSANSANVRSESVKKSGMTEQQKIMGENLKRAVERTKNGYKYKVILPPNLKARANSSPAVPRTQQANGSNNTHSSVLGAPPDYPAPQLPSAANKSSAPSRRNSVTPNTEQKSTSTTTDKKGNPKTSKRGFSLNLGGKKDGKNRLRSHSFGGVTKMGQLRETLKSMIDEYKEQLSDFYNTYKGVGKDENGKDLETMDRDIIDRREGITNNFNDLKMYLNGKRRGAKELYFDKFVKEVLGGLTEDELENCIKLITKAVAYVNEQTNAREDIKKDTLKRKLKDLIVNNKENLKAFYTYYKNTDVLPKKIFLELKGIINSEKQKEDILDFEAFQRPGGRLEELKIDELERVTKMMNSAVIFMNEQLQKVRKELKTVVDKNKPNLERFNKNYKGTSLATNLRYWANGKKRGQESFRFGGLKEIIDTCDFKGEIMSLKEDIDKFISFSKDLQIGNENIEAKRQLLKKWYESHKKIVDELNRFATNTFKKYYLGLRNLFAPSEKEIKEHDKALDVWENSKKLDHSNLMQLIYDVFAERFCKGIGGTNSELDRIDASEHKNGADVESVISTFWYIEERVNNDINMIEEFKNKFKTFLERIYEHTKQEVEKEKDESVNADYLAPNIQVPGYEDVYKTINDLLDKHIKYLEQIKEKAKKLKQSK